jgi:hypothetical protein
MDFFNIDLENNYEASQSILEKYTFDTLLLELHCNIQKENLNASEVKKHFEKELHAKIKEAREIFQANLTNIVKKAIKDK